MSATRYFQILGLSPGVSEQEIKAAYRKLAKKYHPDVSKSESSKKKFQEITEAYDYLLNNGKDQSNTDYKQTSDYQYRKEWARRKAYEEETEAHRKLGEFLKKAFRIIAYLSIPITLFSGLLLFDGFSKEFMQDSISNTYTSLNRYGTTDSNHRAFRIAEWNLDGYMLYQLFDDNFIEEPDRVLLGLSPLFRKLKYAEFYKSDYSVRVVNFNGIYGSYLFTGIVITLIISILAFYFVPLTMNNQLTVSILIIFLTLAEVFMFLVY